MAKTKKQKKLLTPIRISVGLNILLSIIVIAGIAGYMYVKNAYNNGELFVAEWGTKAMQNYCSNAELLQKNKSEFVGYPTDEDKERAFLALNTICDTNGTWGPYYEKALKDYYKDNGVEF